MSKRTCGIAAALLMLLTVLCCPAFAMQDGVIGTSARAMSPNATSQSLGARLEETALGSYVADAFRLGAGADIAVLPGALLAHSLPGGDLTEEDAAAVFADAQTVFTVELTEGQLFDLLEEGVGDLVLSEAERLAPESASDRFLQLSGISVTFDASQRPGGRVRSIEADDGTGFSRAGTRKLTVALPGTMLDGSLGYAWLAEKDAVPVGSASELLCSHISSQGQVEIPELGRYVRLGTSDQTLYEQLHVSSWLPLLIVAIVVVRLSFQRHRARNADGSYSGRYWQ